MERNYLDELRKILNQNISDENKKELLLNYHESDIADLLDVLNEDETIRLHKILGNEVIGDVILHADNLEEIVENLDYDVAADIIETMDSDDAVDVLEELDDDVRKEIVERLEEEAKEDIKTIQQYDEDLIGSKISNNFITISKKDTITSAMKKVINQAAENDNVTLIFVVDEDEKLYGLLELRDLIIARKSDDLQGIVKTNYPFFNAKETVEDCLPSLKEYSLDSYPIVDDEMHLIGVITADNILEVTEEELSEDYAKLAGLNEDIDSNTSIIKAIKYRIPWLVVLLVFGLAQSFLMTGFEAVVATLPIIVFFQTLVLGMSGNTGTQSLAVTIRMLSKDEDKKVFRKAVLKELLVGFINGLVLGVLAGCFVLGFMYFTNQGVVSETFNLIEGLKGAGIVAFSLLISMTISSFIGSFIPLIFKKIKIDPAVASGPFITTINDILSLLIYYGLASVLFSVFA